LDLWYLPSLAVQLFDDVTAQSDALEQQSAYPVKCAVVLVCRAWNDIATEYLYEHVVCGPSETTVSSEALIAVLQDSPKGEQLARMVIRVDIFDSRLDHHFILLRLCPNLQSIYLNYGHYHIPYPYSIRRKNFPTLSIASELLQTPEYQRFWSRADHWHYLTVCFDIPELSEDPDMPVARNNILPPPPASGGKDFVNLRHINFVSGGVNGYSIRNLKHWSLPSITHLTIGSYVPDTGGTYDEVLDVLQSSRLGSQLKFFALLVRVTTPRCDTTARGTIELLRAMPNLEEVALPFFWDSVQLPNSTITFPKVHTVGMEINRFLYLAIPKQENASAIYTETCCRLFPNMRTIRIMSTVPTYTVDFFLKTGAGPMIHLKMAASFLKGRGIKFEDCAGWDIAQIAS
jgi:hypothetical protein